MELPKNHENPIEQKRKEFLNNYFPIINESGQKEIITKNIDRQEINKLVEMGIDLENILHEAIKRGYIFHGSPEDLTELEPRQETKNGPENARLNAVYAIDAEQIAIFCAITSTKRTQENQQSYSTGWSTDCDDEGNNVIYTFRANQAVLDTLDDGFIYAFNKDDFTPNDAGEYVKMNKCKPAVKIPIKVNDFKHEIKLINDSPAN